MYLNRSVSVEQRSVNHSQWLVDRLFAPTGKLLLDYSPNEEMLLLIDRADPSRQAAVPSEAVFTMYCIKKGFLLPSTAWQGAHEKLTPKARELWQNCQEPGDTAYKC